MDAVIAGLLLVTSTLGGSPVLQPVESRTLATTTLTLREAPARPNILAAPQPETRQQTQTRAPRFSKIERAIAIGAGTVIGRRGRMEGDRQSLQPGR